MCHTHLNLGHVYTNPNLLILFSHVLYDMVENIQLRKKGTLKVGIFLIFIFKHQEVTLDTFL